MVMLLLSNETPCFFSLLEAQELLSDCWSSVNVESRMAHLDCNVAALARHKSEIALC